ncbi:MAG: spore coat protein CotH [Clostridiales bacterium]|nr:MAG: spore coat protein CotH [Clostridiales bacterium]
MSKNKYTNIACIMIICFSLLATVLFMNGESLGVSAYSSSLPYESTLFDDSYVHTVDIVVDEDDWGEMLENAADKEYIIGTVVIDNNAVNNVAIRTKGNSSLRDIVKSDSDRYSFKIEFDHYDDSLSYYGLDKLALNNMYQDNTYMKDYLAYQMLDFMDADAPLASYAYITVNGEDWGLYLAVEAVEDSFIDRTYGTDSDGDLYKPETGNDRNNLKTADGQTMERPDMEIDGQVDGTMPPERPDMETDGQADGAMRPERPDMDGENMGRPGGGGGGNMGGSSSNGATLEYTGDDYDSYTDIFDNAKTDITDSDKDTLIAALKKLGEGEDLESVIEVDEVIDYFVVHNYLLNFDSYTGTMLHNYYLFEENGLLSMIGWDYNLSFGTFIYGRDDTATEFVNYPIDTPTTGNVQENRPMLNKILTDDEYLDQYHSEFSSFMESYFES